MNLCSCLPFSPFGYYDSEPFTYFSTALDKRDESFSVMLAEIKFHGARSQDNQPLSNTVIHYTCLLYPEGPVISSRLSDFHSLVYTFHPLKYKVLLLRTLHNCLSFKVAARLYIQWNWLFTSHEQTKNLSRAVITMEAEKLQPCSNSCNLKNKAKQNKTTKNPNH